MSGARAMTVKHSPAFNNSLEYIGAGIASVAAWSISEWVSVIGLVMAVVAFIEGRRRKKRDEARESEKHIAQLEKTRLENIILSAQIEGIERRKKPRLNTLQSEPHDPHEVELNGERNDV